MYKQRNVRMQHELTLVNLCVATSMKGAQYNSSPCIISCRPYSESCQIKESAQMSPSNCADQSTT